MKPMYRQACGALAVLAWMAAPAAAQEPKRATRADIIREIEAQIEQHIELAARQIEHLVDNHREARVEDRDQGTEQGCRARAAPGGRGRAP